MCYSYFSGCKILIASRSTFMLCVSYVSPTLLSMVTDVDCAAVTL